MSRFSKSAAQALEWLRKMNIEVKASNQSGDMFEFEYKNILLLITVDTDDNEPENPVTPDTNNPDDNNNENSDGNNNEQENIPSAKDYKDDEIFNYFLNNNFLESDLYKTSLDISNKIDSVSIREIIDLILDKFVIEMREYYG